PVLVDEADGVDFRADDVAIGFAPFLAEAEGSDVVDIGPRGPAFSEVALANCQKADAAELLWRRSAIGGAPVLHAVDDGIIIRAGARVAAEIDVMHEAAGRVILRAVGEVVAPVDGPEVAGMDHPAAPRAVAQKGQQETALARFLFERMVE